MISSLIKKNETLKEFFGKDELKGKYEKLLMEPDIIPITNFNNSENTIMIYDNFEILDKNTAKQFIYNLCEEENNFLECSLNEEKIIIKYKNNILGNKNYISVIGILNNENTFIK